MDTYLITVTFREPLLGAVPKNENIYAAHIASKAPHMDDDLLEEELESIEDLEEKGWTGFHTDDDGPFLFDYVVKGYLKEACGMLRRASGTRSSNVRAYKKIIDGLVFVGERKIHLEIPDGEELFELERSLRASTPQGERVALARSDAAPAGTSMTFSLKVLGQVNEPLLKEWFDYGELRGFGQWRNATYGAFTYEMEKVE